MKKLVLFVFTFFIVFLSNGQTLFGLKGGLNISKSKNLIAVANERYAFYVGGSIKQPISKNLFVQPELLYSSKGYTFTAAYASSEGANRLNYISFPILLGYHADEKLSILFGPELNYLIKSAGRYGSNVFNFTSQYPRFDAGVDLELTYKIAKKLSAELRYYYGINTLYWTDFAGVKHDEIKGANRTFQMGLTYWLH